MAYLPTLSLNFSDGLTNVYRIHENHVEFQVNGGEWRILGEEEVQLHLMLHTEVSKWLLKHQADMQQHGS